MMGICGDLFGAVMTGICGDLFGPVMMGICGDLFGAMMTGICGDLFGAVMIGIYVDLFGAVMLLERQAKERRSHRRRFNEDLLAIADGTREKRDVFFFHSILAFMNTRMGAGKSAPMRWGRTHQRLSRWPALQTRAAWEICNRCQ
jgi:hypothetical protein